MLTCSGPRKTSASASTEWLALSKVLSSRDSTPGRTRRTRRDGLGDGWLSAFEKERQQSNNMAELL
jgi:hypothetical protein